MSPRLAVPVLLLALAGCASLNNVYNANRLMSEADRLRDRGDESAAVARYRSAAERAARGLERDPTGRWADEALLVLGRSRFHAGDHDTARAALGRLLEDHPESSHAPAARAYLGAAYAAAGRPLAALRHLDAAIPALPRGEHAATAHLWRGRVRLALAGAESAAGAESTRSDPTRARADLDRAASFSGATARAAMLELARLELYLAERPGELASPRQRLSDAAPHRDAGQLLRHLAELDRLLAFAAAPGGELAYFAAAELARDRLGAPRLAAALFLAYADARSDDVWAAKALLAAAALDAPGTAGDARRRLAEHRGNVYVAAARGEAVGGEYEAAERRLERALAEITGAAAGQPAYGVRRLGAEPDTLDGPP